MTSDREEGSGTDAEETPDGDALDRHPSTRRPTPHEVSEALNHGVPTELAYGRVRYEHRAHGTVVRVIVNRWSPSDSTAYYGSREEAE